MSVAVVQSQAINPNYAVFLAGVVVGGLLVILAVAVTMWQMRKTLALTLEDADDEQETSQVWPPIQRPLPPPPPIPPPPSENPARGTKG